MERKAPAKRFASLTLCCLWITLPAISWCAAMSEAWIDRAPTVAQVRKDIRGSDPIDTAARQAATFEILRSSVQTWSGALDVRQMSPRAVAKFREYTNAVGQKLNGLQFNDGACSGDSCTRKQFFDKEYQYSTDPSFTSAMLGRYFAPEYVQAELDSRKPRAHEEVTATPSQTSTPAAARGVAYLIWIVAIGLLVWWFARRNARRLARVERKRKANNQEALRKLGATKDERTKNIDFNFDKKEASVHFKFDPFKCEISRPLAAMSPREREALRTAYHLYNGGFFWTETNFYLVRLALVFGDGKATVFRGNKDFRPSRPGINSISDGIKDYQAEHGLEAMINLTLSTLRGALNKNNDDPILNKLSSRLHGDGGDLQPGAPLKSGKKGEAIQEALFLGLDEKAADKCWYYDGEGALVTVAPPGSGKTQSQVLPNLLMWKGAAVVLDVKGEIYAQTSKWRQQNVGPVYKFSPLDPASSHGYNPLTWVRADPDYLWEDARFLADMMIVPSGAKDPFWETRARDVLTAAIARVCLEEDVAQRSMADVLDILHGVGWDNFVTYLEARVDFRSMSRAGHSLASIVGTLRRFLSPACNSLHLLAQRLVATVLRQDQPRLRHSASP